MTSVAARVDATSGFEERLEHVTSPNGLLYTWTARPAGTTDCVVVCSSIFGDFTSNYHRERTLARGQAQRGQGVMRFHYAGEGNSGGDSREMTLTSLCADTRAVLDHGRRLGFTRFVLVGTRIGALVAATVASELGAANPLVLWEPVDDPLRYLADAQRANRISRSALAGGEVERWEDEMESKGVIHLLGYDVYAPMVHSLTGFDLVAALGTEPRAVFLARFRAKATDPTAEALAARGHDVTTSGYGLSESWWFHSESAPQSGDLIPATLDWIAERLEGPT